MRIKPTHSQRNQLLRANAYRCCVCKRRSIGFHLHHIDGDNANTVDANLAVVCVEDHDRHHRPGDYSSKPNHTELSAAELLQYKNSWESFVAEARQPQPQVLATLSAYGTFELIHSLQLILQWPDETIALKTSYHLLDGDLDRLTDEVFAELASIGPNIKLALINEPLPVEHCPCCGSGLSRTLKPAVVTRLTDPLWARESCACIYINPMQASLALTLFFRHQEILSSSLHLCQGSYLHYHDDWIDERVPVDRRSSVRRQAQNIVNHMLREWQPAEIFIGTGDHDQPELISELVLPECWELTKTERRSRRLRKLCMREPDRGLP